MSQTCLYFMLCFKACACCISTYYFLMFHIKADEWHLCILLHTLCSAWKPVNVASRHSITCFMFCIKAYTINICLVSIVCKPMKVASLCFHLLYSQHSLQKQHSPDLETVCDFYTPTHFRSLVKTLLHINAWTGIHYACTGTHRHRHTWTHTKQSLQSQAPHYNHTHITFKIVRAQRESQGVSATLWYTLREVFLLPIAGNSDLLFAQSCTVQFAMQVLGVILLQ